MCHFLVIYVCIFLFFILVLCFYSNFSSISDSLFYFPSLFCLCLISYFSLIYSTLSCISLLWIFSLAFHFLVLVLLCFASTSDFLLFCSYFIQPFILSSCFYFLLIFITFIISGFSLLSFYSIQPCLISLLFISFFGFPFRSFYSTLLYFPSYFPFL